MKTPLTFSQLFRVAAAMLPVVLLAACGGGSTDEEPAEDAFAGRPQGFPPYVVTVADSVRLPKGVIPADSLTVFGPGVSGMQITDSLWSIDYGWLYLFEEPPLIRSFEEMDSLAAMGRLTDDTKIGVAILRVPLYVKTLQEAESTAVVARPPHPPAALQRFLEQQVELYKASQGESESP